MKPEEYPRETFCKHLNIVTGVLVYFERMNTRSGSLKIGRIVCLLLLVSLLLIIAKYTRFGRCPIGMRVLTAFY